MKRFLLLIREDLKRLEKLTEAQTQDEIRIMTEWVEELTKTGNFVAGEPLEPEARLATKTEVMSDGPFMEREAVSGYTLITAENIEQAAELAMSCPLVQNGLLVIEVRPILTF